MFCGCLCKCTILIQTNVDNNCVATFLKQLLTISVKNKNIPTCPLIDKAVYATLNIFHLLLLPFNTRKMLIINTFWNLKVAMSTLSQKQFPKFPPVASRFHQEYIWTLTLILNYTYFQYNLVHFISLWNFWDNVIFRSVTNVSTTKRCILRWFTFYLY